MLNRFLEELWSGANTNGKEYIGNGYAGYIKNGTKKSNKNTFISISLQKMRAFLNEWKDYIKFNRSNNTSFMLVPTGDSYQINDLQNVIIYKYHFIDSEYMKGIKQQLFLELSPEQITEIIFDNKKQLFFLKDSFLRF